MKLHRLAAVARKEVLQILRDARSIAIVVAMPVMMMLAFGYGISLDVKHLPVYVFDREGSQHADKGQVEGSGQSLHARHAPQARARRFT